MERAKKNLKYCQANKDSWWNYTPSPHHEPPVMMIFVFVLLAQKRLTTMTSETVTNIINRIITRDTHTHTHERQSESPFQNISQSYIEMAVRSCVQRVSWERHVIAQIKLATIQLLQMRLNRTVIS